MSALSSVHSPPLQHPFSVFLASADPENVYPDAAIDLPRLLDNPAYDFPHLIPADIREIAAYLQDGKVVDPLNLVLWGAKSPDQITTFVNLLSGWRSTLLGSPFWGLADSRGSRQKVKSVDSLQKATSAWARGYIVLTRIASSWGRHHVRIFEPIFAGGEWGYIALVGAHTESLGFIRGLPYVWHRISDWHVARDLFAENAGSVLMEDAFESRIFPSEGRWQGNQFDGRIAFLDVTGMRA